MSNNPSLLPAQDFLPKGWWPMMAIAILPLQLLALFSLLQETQGQFDDLGKLLLGGVAAAIVVAVVFSFFRLRLRDKNPPKSDFITIGSTNEKE